MMNKNPSIAELKKEIEELPLKLSGETMQEAEENICRMVDEAFEDVMYELKETLMTAWLIADRATKELLGGKGDGE